jgi:hypothetical protein
VRPILYRSYKPADLPALVQLDQACFDPPFRFGTPTMRRFAEAENAWVTLAEENGNLTGFCILHRERADTMDIGYVVTIESPNPAVAWASENACSPTPKPGSAASTAAESCSTSS